MFITMSLHKLMGTFGIFYVLGFITYPFLFALFH